MPSLRIFGVLLVTLGLIGFIGDSSFVTAGGNPADPPHETHLTHVRGPAIGLGLDCAQCHTGTPDQNNVDDNSCNSCHSSGGVFDGVNDPNIGAKNNWMNKGSSASATQSLIYENGTLKSGKEKWCATCHDAPDAGEVVLAVDDFEGYASDSALRAVWEGKQDAKSTAERANPFLAPSAPPPQGSESMEVDVWWEKTTYTYGTVSRVYSPVLNLDAADTVGFWLRLESTSRFSGVKVKLRVLNDTAWSTGTVNFNTFGIEAWEWKWIQIPRADFTNNGDWSTVNKIQFRANENSGTNYHVSFWIDDVKILTSGSLSDAPDVAGDNQTRGYYVTGHRFDCTYCHDPSSEHIDGERPASIYDYFTHDTNPTGFRLYSDYGYGLQLPYNTYVPGPDGAFALCYQCHDESVITQDALAEALVTNFTDENWIATGPENLHLEHIGLSPVSYHVTCVMCHDPHGQANPAMVRTDVGGFLNYDTNGCEIPVGADSDEDGTDDRHDPDVNMGGAQKKAPSESYPMCNTVCHTVAAPPNPDCAGSNPYLGYQGMDGFYKRSYEYVSHEGNMDVGPVSPGGPIARGAFRTSPRPWFPAERNRM
ncbi:MAG: hypothetical protein JRF64_07590 [Deltaproteobacteria bacterium]|nr:hypothetical protein [Deltaproteobacteria bacterium]